MSIYAQIIHPHSSLLSFPHADNYVLPQQTGVTVSSQMLRGSRKHAFRAFPHTNENWKGTGYMVKKALGVAGTPFRAFLKVLIPFIACSSHNPILTLKCLLLLVQKKALFCIYSGASNETHFRLHMP